MEHAIFGGANPYGGGDGLIASQSGGYYKTLASNPWASIIDVPRGKEHLYSKMPAMGGLAATNPGTVYNPHDGDQYELYFKNGKKQLKRVKTNKKEERPVTRDEALQNPKLMFKYLKQFNKKMDKKHEAEELDAYMPPE